MRVRRVPGWLVPLLSFLVGAVPLAGLAASWRHGVDLRRTGSQSVTTTNLLSVAGPFEAGLVGALEVAKGVVGARLARGHSPALGVVAGVCVVAGHNWSPFLHGAGGRGLAPAIGVLIVTEPAAAVVLVAGPVAAIATGEPVIAMAVTTGLAVPVLAVFHSRRAALTAAVVLAPVAVKSIVRQRGVGPRRRFNPLRDRYAGDRYASEWGRCR